MLWNRFGQSEDYSVYHTLSSDPLQNGQTFLDEISEDTVNFFKDFFFNHSLNHFQQTLVIPATLIASLFCQISSEDKTLSNDGMWFIISAVV